MASKKDMRRADLAIPYVDPPKDKNEADMTGAMSSTMPMAANDRMGFYRLFASVMAWGDPRTEKECFYTSIYVRFNVLDGSSCYIPPYLPTSTARQRWCRRHPVPFPFPLNINNPDLHLVQEQNHFLAAGFEDLSTVPTSACGSDINSEEYKACKNVQPLGSWKFAVEKETIIEWQRCINIIINCDHNVMSCARMKIKNIGHVYTKMESFNSYLLSIPAYLPRKLHMLGGAHPTVSKW